ncbi:MAG: alpha/beta hydrolase [Rhodospirillaceae bacterium]
MSPARISLQNTPTKPGVTQRPLAFDSAGVTLQGVLYLPEAASAPLPAVIVTGAWTTVKGQMAGTYARELAARGFAALAFDFTGWGESAGVPRYVEDPAVKTQDILAAAQALAALPEVDAGALSGLGICASSGYMAAAVADSAHLQKLALVAPWLHDPAMAEGIYGGPEVAANLIATSEAENAAETVLVAASAEDQSAVMFQAPYYTEADRGLIPDYDNQFSVLSWKPWLTYDAQASADRLTKPVLMVGSPAIALPAGAAAYEARTKAPLEKLWLGEDVTQFDFYDRADVVTSAADAVAGFFSDETLSSPR